jgi:peptidoglycan/LPS O-acetylase OafA/YrhL
MSTADKAGPAHLDALTGIRGIAAWAVVFYHIRLSLTGLFPTEAIAVMARGYLAVDLFFILSGFVIWYNYADRLRSGGVGEARLFLWRRIARIWPLHAAILLAMVGFVAVLALTGRSTAGYPLAELPLHLLLVQNWGFTPALSWNHPAWSISTEFAAYLLFPLVVLAADWRRAPTWLLGLIVLILLGGIHALFAAFGYRALGYGIEHLGLLRCLAAFTLGNIMCLLWQRWRNAAHGGLLAGLSCLGLVAGGVMLGLPETAFAPAAFLSGLMALALGRGILVRLLATRPLVYLGEISYSTYLAHFFLFILWKIAFVDASLQLGWNGLAGFLALVLVMSVALYHGLEKPAQRWLNAHPPRWAERPAAVAAE